MDESVKLHEVNETTTDAICDLYSSLMDFMNDEEFIGWSSNFSTELQLGFANSLKWCELNEAGEMMVRVSYVALLNHVGLTNYYILKHPEDFYNEIGFDVE